jgi:cytochrome P450
MKITEEEVKPTDKEMMEEIQTMSTAGSDTTKHFLLLMVLFLKPSNWLYLVEITSHLEMPFWDW